MAHGIVNLLTIGWRASNSKSTVFVATKTHNSPLQFGIQKRMEHSNATTLWKHMEKTVFNVSTPMVLTLDTV